MGFLVGMSLPILVVVLFVLGLVELALARRRHGRGRGRHGGVVASTGFDLLQQALYPSKRHELEQRAHEELAADEAEEGAPPRTRIDLDRGTAHVHLPSRPTGDDPGR